MLTSATSLELEGLVAPGLGEGSRFTAIEWVIAEFRKKLGFVPWPGTFNLYMHGRLWKRGRSRMLAEAAIDITPQAGFCAAKCFAVRIAGQITGAVVLPEMEGYPDNKLEIVAPVPVRETLGVRDGDRVHLRIDIAQSTVRSR